MALDCQVEACPDLMSGNAVQPLRNSGKDVDDRLLRHLSPLGWEHINLTCGYIWRQSRLVEQGKFRPLCILGEA